MSTITPTVEIWFDLSSQGGDLFTLNDPVKGKLDDTTYLLAGDLAVDISDYVTTISVDRGRSRELDEIQPGTATVSLDNYDGRFLPDELDTDANMVYGEGNIVPGKRIRVSLDGVALFDGVVDDWNFDYRATREISTQVVAVDAMSELARKELDSFTATAQLEGARIEAILDRAEVDYGQNRDIDAGQDTLQTDQVDDGTNVLNYLQVVAKTDLGRLFASRTGVLTFRDRLNSLTGTTDVTFTDDETGVAFHGIDVAYGSELLSNRVAVTRDGGNQQTSTRQDSVDKYGIRTLSLTGLLFNSDADALNLAEYLSGIYAEPQLRIQGLRVVFDDLSASDRTLIAQLELGDTVDVTWTPPGMTTPVTQTLIVEGIAHSADRNGLWEAELRLTPVALASTFTLDSPVLGRLDFNVLTF